jgi:RimJ/RimL family protein N-acetyltransferase
MYDRHLAPANAALFLVGSEAVGGAMDIKPVSLIGRFVRLEPMRLEHADALSSIGAGRDIFRYFPVALDTPQQIEGYVRLCVAGGEAGTLLTWVTVPLETGQPAGSTGYLNIDRHHRKLEIGGTWIVPEWQRTACNTEAKYLQLQHAFETLDCNRVEFKTDSLNERSRAALARIGAIEEGTMRNHMVMPDGRLRHSVYFSVIKSEWPSVRARLEALLER